MLIMMEYQWCSNFSIVFKITLLWYEIWHSASYKGKWTQLSEILLRLPFMLPAWWVTEIMMIIKGDIDYWNHDISLIVIMIMIMIPLLMIIPKIKPAIIIKQQGFAATAQLFPLVFPVSIFPSSNSEKKCCSATVKLEPKRIYHNIPSAYLT